MEKDKEENGLEESEEDGEEPSLEKEVIENQGFVHTHEEIDTLTSQERFFAPVLEETNEISQNSSLEQTAEIAPNFSSNNSLSSDYSGFTEYKNGQANYASSEQSTNRQLLELSANSAREGFSLSPIIQTRQENRKENPITTRESFERLQESYKQEHKDTQTPGETRKNSRRSLF